MVTGASEGIGQAFARALARDGWAVTLVARSRERLASLQEELPGSAHQVLPADLGTREGVAAVEHALSASRVHLLVNNAGVGLLGGFVAHEEEAHLALVRLNVEALTRLAHAFCRQAQAGDGLINVSSVLAAAPQPAQPVYAATKAYVSSLSESLWHEMRPRGVHVLNLQPGATRTAFGQHAGRPATWRRPSWLSQSPESVAAYALSAWEARRGPTVTTGLGNRLFVRGATVLPRRWLLALMARAT